MNVGPVSPCGHSRAGAPSGGGPPRTGRLGVPGPPGCPVLRCRAVLECRLPGNPALSLPCHVAQVGEGPVERLSRSLRMREQSPTLSCPCLLLDCSAMLGVVALGLHAEPDPETARRRHTLALRLGDRDRAVLQAIADAWGVPAGIAAWAFVVPHLRRCQRTQSRLRGGALALRALAEAGHLSLADVEAVAAVLRERARR